MTDHGTVHVPYAECEALKAQLQQAQQDRDFLRKREADICAAVPEIADGGRYRNDIVSALSAMRQERDATQAHVAVLRGAVVEAQKIHDRYCDRVGAADSWARFVHKQLCAALSTTPDSAYREWQAMRRSLKWALDWILSEMGTGDENGTPKHWCDFTHAPEEGYCEFHDKYWTARFLVDPHYDNVGPLHHKGHPQGEDTNHE